MIRAASFLVLLGFAAAETGIDAWLRYAPLPGASSMNISFPSSIVALNSSNASPVYSAGQELQKGIQSILGKNLTISSSGASTSSAIVVGQIDEYTGTYGSLANPPALLEDGYWLSVQGSTVQILGHNERGALYGTFQYLRMLAQGNFSNVAYMSNPAAPVRWVNQWDNLDGSITRGYGGPSIFFNNGTVVDDLTRASQYGRILASIGLNGLIVNNVNANSSLLSDVNMAGLGRIADVFRPWGVRIGISQDFAAPQDFGNLSTYDPVDPSVVAWWQNTTDNLYKHVPDMCGYLVKADSEGQPGPLVYNRTLAQGANVFAQTLQPYGGVVMFRAFVYNQLNESVWTADRANAAVQFFTGLDGQFDENVIVQIKYGPIDFQVREPASPLFGYLQKTNTAIELEVTQEYLGQQCHLVYLPPLWDTVLNFDMRVDNQTTYVKDIITGQRFNRPLGGSAAVVNVGTNNTWLGSHLSQSNLYGYGRLAWDWNSDPQAIVQEWSRLTFGLDPSVVDTITSMSMDSWPAYENYSGNLGLQTLTDILYTHFGPNPQSQDNNGWGQWTRADNYMIGMDRTCFNGTGNGTCFAGQYPPQVYEMYENIDTTPDNLLLWFHHVNYTQQLKSGKTVIQDFYDQHYAGADMAQTFSPRWQTLEGKIDSQRYQEQLFRLNYQAGHSIVWRDAISNFYHNLSSINDTQGRVGSHPWRIEAESMNLNGYVPYTVSPFETASNYTAIVTATNTTVGTAWTTIPFDDGVYDIGVNYYDMANGYSNWKLSIGGVQVGYWLGDNENVLGHDLSIYLDGHTATRQTFPGVSVKKGQQLTLVGIPNGMEPAPIDYVVFLPSGQGIVD